MNDPIKTDPTSQDDPNPKRAAEDDPPPRRAAGCSPAQRFGAAAIGVVAFGVVIVAWFWMMRQPPQAQVSMGMPQVVFVTAAAIGVASLIAELRAMTLWDVVLTGLEWIVSAMAGLVWLAVQVLKIVGGIIVAIATFGS